MRHLRTHDEKREKFQCDLCEKVYVKKVDFIDHKKGHDNKVSCDQCGKDFFTNKLLLLHLKTHDKSNVFTCEVCQWKFHSVQCVVEE